MFEGKAEEAMNFYTGIIPQPKIIHITRYKANERGPEETVMQARFTLNGEEYMCIDSRAKHAFTHAISLFILAKPKKRQTMSSANVCKWKPTYAPGPYPFSKKFGWLSDKYGVSWQLILKNNA